MKLGQVLSTRPDLVPPDYESELARLQDAAPTVPSRDIVVAVETALGRPLRGVDQGVDSFGMIAATLIALATLFGCSLLAMRLFKKWRFSELLIGTHATFAVGGFVFLAVYVLLG